MKRFVVLCLLLAMPATAQEKMVMVEHAWARATSASQRVGGVFLTLHAHRADRLLSVDTPVADMAELHETVKEGDVMRMRPIAALDLPAGGMTELKPGGYHLMLMGLRQPLTKGATFPLSLHFAHAGLVTVLVEVQAAGAAGIQHMHMP